MDIEHNANGSDDDGVASDRQIILPQQNLPGVIHVIPQERRPFFPGQAVPLLMNAEVWLPTLKAVKETGNGVLGLVATQRDLEGQPTPHDFYEMGTVCRIHRVQEHEGHLQVLLEGLQRFRIREWLTRKPPLAARVRYYPEERAEQDSRDLKAYATAIINTIRELVPLNPLYAEELKMFLGRSNPNEPAVLADFAAALTTASKEALQQVLETLPLLPRLEKALELLNRELQIARTQQEIRQHVEERMQEHQREALLKQQLKYIQKELGLEKDDKTAEIEEFKGRLEGKTVPEKAQKRIDEELQKLAMLEVGSPEYGVTRNYLDWLTALPWGIHTQDCDDLGAAADILDESHDGLDDVKERIVEFLALGISKGEVAGSIILLVGPPGVGKTSLGRSIAKALGREFFRFSVGGMRDEAEIKGHRRTYIGAMPGKMVQALKDCGSANPVVMLDEVDKIGASYQGDPASALLEVLDPEQNVDFHDHYLDVHLDLSKVLFVCTANTLDTIPGPLLDRMEIIHLGGYLADEKLRIARNHLWPRQLERAGLRKRGDVNIDKAALRTIIEGYAREAGVRRLEKDLGTVVRKAVVKLLKGEAEKPVRVQKADVEDYLGMARHQPEKRQHGVGVVTGLAWTAMGGATLPVEATRVHTREHSLKVTGQLGDVMKESAQIAWGFLEANAEDLGADPEWFANAAIQLHVPAGATPKDGPSAGVTMATALLSLARGERPAKDLAMTGELTLTGHVYPVGGIREKLIAARRQKFRQVLLPAANRRDVEELPDSITEGLDIHYAERFEDVVERAFPA